MEILPPAVRPEICTRLNEDKLFVTTASLAASLTCSKRQVETIKPVDVVFEKLLATSMHGQVQKQNQEHEHEVPM